MDQVLLEPANKDAISWEEIPDLSVGLEQVTTYSLSMKKFWFHDYFTLDIFSFPHTLKAKKRKRKINT
jgi:hypothetical protein